MKQGVTSTHWQLNSIRIRAPTFHPAVYNSPRALFQSSDDHFLRKCIYLFVIFHLDDSSPGEIKTPLMLYFVLPSDGDAVGFAVSKKPSSLVLPSSCQSCRIFLFKNSYLSSGKARPTFCFITFSRWRSRQEQ